MGRRELEAGNAREALDLFKHARQKDEGLKGLDCLFWAAYTLRARQLAAKGMDREAEAMRALAEQHRASIDPRTLSDADFVGYLGYLPLADAIRAYADALNSGRALPGVERRLADRLVTVRCWDALSALEGDHPLRRDAPHVQEAAPSMDSGDWTAAGTTLAPISRRSPFAPWRVFCRAMVCFCEGDNEGLARTIAMLPEDFALCATVAEWKRMLAPSGEASATAEGNGVAALLWEDGADADGLARALADAVRGRRFAEVEKIIPPLSRALYPEDPKAMCATLLEALSIAVRREGMPLQGVLRLAGRLLPHEMARLVSARIGLAAHQPSHAQWVVAPAAEYLSLMPVEFPDARRQALARGRVLEHLARTGHEGGACPYCVGPRTMGMLWNLLGERSDDPSMVFADLMLASLKADPDNRDGYAFLLSLLKGKRSAKPKVEQALRDMMDRFREDAAPCLELAALYYSRNAYRKAEAALEEAQRRAPHDEQVLDRHAIGYIKSADQSLKRRRRDIAERDYDRAEALGRRRVAPILFAKRLGMSVLNAGIDALEEVQRRLEALPLVERARSLVLLIHDLEWMDRADARALRWLKRMLTGMLEDRAISGLSSAEAVALMRPIEEIFDIVYEDLQVAEALSDFWKPLLAQAEDEDLMVLFDILLACEGRTVVREEIDRRLSGTPRGDRDPVLLLYLAALRYMEGIDYGSHRFREAADGTDGAQRRRLQEAGVRIAEFAHGPLQDALKRFDFEVLDRLPGFGGPPRLWNLFDEEEEEEEEEDDDEDIEEDEEESDVFDFLDMIEEAIDSYGLRGAPMPELREAAGRLRSDPRFRRQWDGTARDLQPLAGDLSREARVLLYPRRR